MVLQIPTSKPIVLAESVYHKLNIHALAEGGGVLKFKGFSMFGIRIIPIDGEMNKVQLIAVGKNDSIDTSIFRREKKIMEKPKKEEQVAITFKEQEVEEI